MNVSESVRSEARELGAEALAKLDPLCDEHLRTLEFHPTNQEFQGTHVYSEFEDLVWRHAKEQGFDWEECDPTVQDELWREVREAFDEGFYNPADQAQCVGCLEDGDISIRVNDPDSLSAEAVLDGKAWSGHVGRDGEDEWR